MASPILPHTLATLLTLQNLGLFSIVLIIFITLYQIVYNHFFHPLSEYPGPFLAGITRAWLAWHNYYESETAVCWELVQKHGPVVRITPNLLLVAKAQYLPSIYHRKAVKTKHYNLLGFGKIASTFHSLEHEDHANRRKMTASAYAFSNHKSTEEVVDRRVQDWIAKLEELFVKGKDDSDTGVFVAEKSFDFSEWASFLTYDIMAEVTGGQELGCVKNGSDEVGLIKAFIGGLWAFGILTRFHTLATAINWTWIGRFLEWQIPYNDPTVGVLMRYAKKMLRERLVELNDPEKEKKDDMLQRLLDLRSSEGTPMSLDSIHAELVAILLAGADTISTTSCALITQLLNDPTSLTRILDETDKARASGKLSPIPRQVEVQENCPYYVACLKESMRLWPSVPAIFPREVRASHPLVLEGREIPPGTEVTCNPWMIARDPEAFGDDCELWKPERWLYEEGKKLEKYNLALGYGSRVCLGKDLGMLELMEFPLLFLETFDATLDGDKQTPIRQRCVGGVASWEDVWMSIQLRKDGMKYREDIHEV